MNKSIYIIIAKGASEPGCEQGEPRVPKKEISIDRINPINPRGELACSLLLRTKIEHISLNFRPFEAAFSGIGCGLRSL